MTESPAGFLVAEASDDNCRDCGMCLRVCPGRGLNFDHPDLAANPFQGSIIGAFIGYALDETIRQNAQSGGVATAINHYLLATRQADTVLGASLEHEDRLRPRGRLLSKPEDLKAVQSSKYCPVPLVAAMPFSLQDRRVAVTGLPCHLHGIINGQQFNPSWQKNISLKIGLICDRTLSYLAMDYFCHLAGTPPNKVRTFKFRHKLTGDLHLTDTNDALKTVPNRYRLLCKDVFTSARCRLCFDKFNIFSDITIGDAWGVKEDNKGYSAILVRSERGMQILREAAQAGYLNLETTSPRSILDGQAQHAKQKAWALYTDIWKSLGRTAPDFRLDPRWNEHLDEANRCDYRKHFLRVDRLDQCRSSRQAFRRARLHLTLLMLRNRIALRSNARRLWRAIRPSK